MTLCALSLRRPIDWPTTYPPHCPVVLADDGNCYCPFDPPCRAYDDKDES